MNSRPDLRLDWIDAKAARYACEHWHYSHRMPSGALASIGVWEGNRYIGAVIFGRGANNHLAGAFGLVTTDVCELVRVALRSHATPVSRILRIALALLQRRSPELRLVVSYADPAHKHIGAIYQAGNWVFDGQQQGQTEYLWRGRQYHGRSVTATRGTVTGLPKLHVPGKYRYLMPLDSEMRSRIEPLRKPYPKRPKQATVSDHEASGGAAPTRTLQTSTA